MIIDKNANTRFLSVHPEKERRFVLYDKISTIEALNECKRLVNKSKIHEVEIILKIKEY